jgi:hypothetical protein
MVWLAKGIGGCLLVVLNVFNRQKVLVALQRAQVAFILRHIIIIGEGFSRLTIFLGFPKLSFFNILLATDEGFET